MKKIIASLVAAAAIAVIFNAPVKACEVTDPNGILSEINEERAQRGEKPLTVDSELSRAALIRAEEASIMFSHGRPNGAQWFSVSNFAYGENLAYATIGENVVDMWMSSPAHADNILYGEFKTTGLACYTAPDGYVYLCQLFGY